ncbi:MAG: SO_0444 family Cu/Zn efflux transporter [Prevotella sp.]|nr:SO_0444 family Cu/Zn efflux transporter [Prevotella sp.]
MNQFIDLVTEMSPYLLLGFLLAGLMHAFIPGTIYSKYLAKPNMRSVVLAALFGIPLPLCSCGVLPTAMSLRREGASKGAAVSFLIATPQTGVDSIIATFSLMGLPFAIIRPIAALATAIFGGKMVNVIEGDEGAGKFDSTNEQAHDDLCGDSCCGGHDKVPTSFAGKVIEALRYAYIDMMESVGKWLVVGLVVAGLITIFVPDSYFEIFKDNSFTSMLLVLCISIPMYLCATGSIPIAVALMMKGLTPGAALVLLMAGPACSVASVLVVSKVLGRRTLTAYLFSIISGAVGFGLVTDYLLPRAWFISHLVANDACCEEKSSLFATSCTILLFLLLANAFIRRRFRSKANINSKNTMKQTFIIKGMSCNHCRMSAEKAILSVKGVTSASVDLGSKQAVVEGDFSPEDVCKAVEETGFSCSLL